MNQVDNSAGRVRRLFAAGIDFVIVAIVAFCAMLPLGIFEHQEAYVPTQFVMRLFLLVFCSYLVVNGWLMHKYGQTLGKRLLGLRVVGNTDAQLLPLWKLLIRYFTLLGLLAISALVIPGAILLLLALAIIDLLFMFAPKRRCLHDYLAGSTVIKVNEDSK
jgi:uncharacterized RDD family membrane protein YckC